MAASPARGSFACSRFFFASSGSLIFGMHLEESIIARVVDCAPESNPTGLTAVVASLGNEGLPNGVDIPVVAVCCAEWVGRSINSGFVLTKGLRKKNPKGGGEIHKRKKCRITAHLQNHNQWLVKTF